LRLEIRKGNLPAYKAGARVIILAADFENYLMAGKVPTPGGIDR
jgi:hypothetical protein